MAKIYLSSTYSDLIDQRRAVYEALRQMRHDVIAMEDYVAADRRPLEKCLADVAESDLYVGLFAWRYGYIPAEANPDQKSITELEYRRAAELGKPCLIFLLAEDAPWPPTDMDARTGDGDRGQRIEALREEFSQEKLVTFFQTAEELAQRVATAVHNWEEAQREQTPAPPQTGRAAPPGPPLERLPRAQHFTNRKQELEKLLADLQPGRVVTLRGPGGIGKSALAAEALWQLAPANEPPGRFPDGIFIHQFYNQPQAALALEAIARSFGEEPKPTPRDAAQRALANKQALLLLDGTEQADDLTAVLDVAPTCGVLVTSRTRRDVIDEQQEVQPLETDEAVKLLQDWGKEQAADVAAARRICTIVGGCRWRSGWWAATCTRPVKMRPITWTGWRRPPSRPSAAVNTN